MNKDIFTSSYVIVEELLKKSPYESTEIVYLSLPDGSRQGPYIRKIFDKSSGLGNTYKQLFDHSENNFARQIPNIYSVFEDSNKLVVFEEYICGETLDKYIAHENFNIDIISKIFNELCCGVNYLHTNFPNAIIHRDIKPSNILITANGQVKLIDFGISRNYENSDNPDTHKFGTVGYAPPEQFGYKQTDVRSDIYSLGKVLDFLCNQSNWVWQDIKINDNIFKEVINKACEFDPSYRYKNVSQFITEFNKVEKTSSNKLLILAGYIWNILLLLVVAFLICITFVTISDPNNANSQMPIISKALFCFILIGFIFIPFWLVFSYKPSLRKIFKSLPYFKFWHYVIFILACITGTTVFAIIAQIFS